VRHVLDMKDFSKEEVERLVERALQLKKMRQRPKALRGKFLATAFFEPSTRTKLSFQRAAKELGMKVIDFITEISSLRKGETDLDTLLTLEAMEINAIVVRTRKNEAPKYFAQHLSVPVINGGDGTNEHPTQAFLDLTTLYEHFAKLDLRVAIVGDILHSRVARSLVEGLNKFGANVRLCGPEEFVPKTFPGVELIAHDLREAVKDVDAIYTLRIQKERLEQVFDNVEEFFIEYQINEEILKAAPSHAVIMHPGPINRNVEISDEVAYSKRSLILNQVKNGVYARMAVLEEALRLDETVRSLEESMA